MTANKTNNTINTSTLVFENCNNIFSNSFYDISSQYYDSWRTPSYLSCRIPDRDLTPEDGPSEWEQKKMAELAELARDDE